VQRNSEGDGYIDLGKKKHATVRAFKNIPLLDIREFYGTGSEEKPGKKGISLTLEQWQVLRANVETIDQLFSEISK
ncbi:ssDNA-binding transcriptional regulator, partial [Macrolepiota fuliginosa MF-IS2]